MLKSILVQHDAQTRDLVGGMAKQSGQLLVVQSCSTLTEALNTVAAMPVDLLILDVITPGFKKTKFLSRIKDHNLRILAIGAEREAAADAFELDAVDFILKPVTTEKFLKALKKVLHLHHRKERADTYLFVKVNNHIERLDVKNIVAIEAMSDYVHIHTKDKRYTVHDTMKDMETRLPANDFMRVHRSYIIRLAGITELDSRAEYVVVAGKSIPVSETYRQQLIERINIFGFKG